jgi:GcrA cell cycle regulator
VKSWTGERIEVLKQRLAEGRTAATIKNELNGLEGKRLTRNAIIGKAHRDKLVWAGSRDRMPTFLPRRAVAVQVTLPVPMPQCQLIDLNPATCRWPSGTPGCADFFFCGEQASAMSPYCERHHRVAFRLPPSHRMIGGAGG